LYNIRLRSRRTAVEVFTERAVERSGAARADAVFVHRVHHAVFDGLVAEEVVIVVGGEIYTRPVVYYDVAAGLVKNELVLLTNVMTDALNRCC